MARNLRQKYKDAKKQIQHMIEWQFLRQPKSMVVDNVPLRKFRATRMFRYGEMEQIPKPVLMDIAFDLAKHMIENNMVNITESFDPYRGETCIVAEILVADKKDA